MSARQLALHNSEMDDAPAAAGSARRSSFYTAMRIMPLREREAMYAIYGFCRAIDDIADEAGGDAQQVAGRLARLQQWRHDIASIYAGNTPPRLQALANAIAEFALQQPDFMAVIDGMEMDVRGPMQAPDFATLECYCDRVACAVGRLSVQVFGIRGQDGLQLAHHLGMALQLTNILRDIDEDAAMNRLYLPRELLENAGIAGHDPAAVLTDPAIENICRTLAGKALTHFHEADVIMKRHERKRVRTPRVMSRAYHAIHTALMARGFAYPRQPVRLNKAKLGYILVRTMVF